LKPLRRTRKPVPSGDLLPKFGPARGLRKFKLEDPRSSEPKFLARHTHWRVMPREKLSKSPLNPTDSYGDSYSRRKVTLEGSERYVKLQPAPGLALPLGQVVPPPGLFSEATLQPVHAPPPREKSINSNYNLPAIAFELDLVLGYLNSKLQHSRHIGSIDILTRQIVTSAGPTRLGVLDEWKSTLIPAKLLAINSQKLNRRKSLPSKYQTIWREHSELINSKIRDVEQLIKIRSSGSISARQDGGSTVLEGSDPLGYWQGDFPTDSDASNMGDPAIHPLPQPNQQASAQLQPSAAQPSSFDILPPLGDSQTGFPECNAPRPLPLAEGTSVDAQTSNLDSSSTASATTPLGAPLLPATASMSKSNTPDPELLHPVGSIVVAPPSPSPTSSVPSEVPDIASTRKARRSSAPYPETSSHCLSTTDSLLLGAQATMSRRKSYPESIIKASKVKINASQAHAASSTIQPQAAQTDTAALLKETIVTQTRYQLLSHKRSADGDSAPNTQHPDERSSKRRRV
jgi:hypothetical protein